MAKKRRIIVFTHGPKESGGNPHMTQEGFMRLAGLKQFIPRDYSMVVCGTGNRHMDVAKSLGLTPNRYSSIAGIPDSLEVIDGKNMIVLADGTAIPEENCTSVADETHAIKAFMKSLPDNSLVCAGRVIMIELGLKDAKSGMAYLVIENKLGREILDLSQKRGL